MPAVAVIRVHSASQILAGLWVSVFLCLAAFAAEVRDQDSITIEFYDNGIRQLWLREIPTGDRLWDDMPWPNGHSHLRTEETRLKTPNVCEFLFMMPPNGEMDNLSPKELNQRVSAQLKDSVMRQMAAGKTDFQIQIVQNIGFGDAKLESTPRHRITDRTELFQTDHDGTYFDAMQQFRVRRFGQAVGVAITELVQNIKREKNRDTALYFTPASNGGVLFTEAAPFLEPVKDSVKQVDLVESQATVAGTVKAAQILGEEKFTLSTTLGNYPSPSHRTGSLDGIVEVLKKCPAARGFYTIPESPKNPHIKRSASPEEQLRFKEIVLYNNKRGFTFRDAGVTSGEAFRFQLRDANYRNVYSGNKQARNTASESFLQPSPSIPSRGESVHQYGNDVQAGSPLNHVTRVEALTFADLVYDQDFGRRRLPDGWNLLRSGDAGLEDSPLRWALYERASDGQRILSFAGTRRGRDWLDNLYSSSSFPPAQDLIRGRPELYKALGLSPHFQYDQAYQKTLDELQANKYSGKGKPLVLVGDSKAGGQVEYASSMTRTFGVARDPAPLGDDLLSRVPKENRKWANDGGVLRLELVPDPVSKLDALPGSTHLGLQESYGVPKVWRDEYMKNAVTPNFVESAVGVIGYTVFSHTERDLLLRAVTEKEATARKHSPAAGKLLLPPAPNVPPQRAPVLEYPRDTKQNLSTRIQLYPSTSPSFSPPAVGRTDSRPPPAPPTIIQPNNLGGISFRPRGRRITLEGTEWSQQTSNNQPKP